MVSDLKLSYAGSRSYLNLGNMSYQDNYGRYWSSSPSSDEEGSYLRFFSGGIINPSNSHGRAYGFSVRCFKT